MIENWNIILTISIVSFVVIHFGLYFLFLRRETDEKKNESHKKKYLILFLKFLNWILIQCHEHFVMWLQNQLSMQKK